VTIKERPHLSPICLFCELIHATGLLDDLCTEPLYVKKKEGSIMSIITKLFIIVAIVVTITDVIVFHAVSKNPNILTVHFVIMVIIVTIIPIAINFWFHSRKL
jgi:hypothetical protein